MLWAQQVGTGAQALGLRVTGGTEHFGSALPTVCATLKMSWGLSSISHKMTVLPFSPYRTALVVNTM